MFPRIVLRWFVRAIVLISAFPSLALGHDFKLGDLRIDHPYAILKVTPVATAEIYFRSLRNEGVSIDRLLKITTPVAQQAVIRTETHSVDHEITWVPIMSLEIPAKGKIPIRHDSTDGYQILISEFVRPLREGDRFPITLSFEYSGDKEVMVWVQTPRQRTSTHKH